MIFQYLTRKINGLDYIRGSRLISEKGTPSNLLEFSKAFSGELCDANNKLQWTIRENPKYDPEVDHIDDRYIIEHDPIQPTVEELEADKQAVIKRQLVTELPDIILQNKNTPGLLIQALCDRAKQIEVENETRRDPETIDSKVP